MNGPQAGIPLEVVACVTAAISAVLDQPVGSFVITSIRPEQGASPVSAWSTAGVLESHLARRQFGIRSR